MLKQANVRSKNYRAFSLIELLVVLGIVGLMFSLAIPAIQTVRESARRLHCQNNLKQIGIALQNYQTANQTFPLNWDSRLFTPEPKAGGIARPFSAYTRLLAYLDNSAVYAALNFSEQLYPCDSSFDLTSFPMNATAYGTRVSLFVCPADNNPGGFTAGCNYRANYGIGPQPGTTEETYDSGTGFYTFFSILSPPSFTDGLSHTVAYSERMMGSGEKTVVDRSRDMGRLNDFSIFCAISNADFALNCSRIAAIRAFPRYTRAGYNWFLGDFESAAYCHAQEPNGPIPDSLGNAGPQVGIVTSRSFHPGGVNSMMADGSVRFVSGTITRAVWRGLGTRSGNELVE